MDRRPAKRPARLSTMTTTTTSATKVTTVGARILRQTQSQAQVQAQVATPTSTAALHSGPASPIRKFRDAAAVQEKENREDSLHRPDEPSPPWQPAASLIPHTTAPLSSRVSVPPTTASVPAWLRPPPLADLSLEAQEQAIITDLLFVLMGHEGNYIQYSPKYDPTVEVERLVGPSFQIAPGLDPSLKDLTRGMLGMATQYSALEAFVEVQSRAAFGAVLHALCATVRKLLKEYLILIVQLEAQHLNNPSFTLHSLHLHLMPTSQNLAQLYALGQDLLRRNALLATEEDESMLDFDDVDDILEQLKEGGELGGGGAAAAAKRACKGGSVLTLLTQRLATCSGDPTACTLLQNLLREASRPYMTMLNEWLHHGAIKDPHAEFLIKEQKGIKRDRLEEDYTDEYWDKRYTVRDADVPPQLEAVRDKVLLAGKYLNVVRECGGIDVSKEVRDVPLTFDDPNFLDNIAGAYTHANASLLNLLLAKNSLAARFRSLKHYFFLDQADFFTHFIELGGSELRKPAKNVNEAKLQSLLDLCLRQPGSNAAQDPFTEDVKLRMNHLSLTKWLMRVVSVSGTEPDHHEAAAASSSSSSSADADIIGFEALELDYLVPFPLSLVISRKTVLRYQLLFRYLLSLRYLESLLLTSWQDHIKAPSWRHKSSDPRLERWKHRAWTLRARMLIFVQQLLYFSTAEVIEPNWLALMERMSVGGHGVGDRGDAIVTGDAGVEDNQDREGQDADTADTTSVAGKANTGTGVFNGGAAAAAKQVDRTVDELMQDHVDFLDTCLKECMLTQSKLLKIHSKLMACCTMFAQWTASSLSRGLASADPDLTGEHARPDVPGADASRAYDETRLPRLQDTLKRYESHFNRHLRVLMDSLNYFAATESVVLLKLAHSLSTITKED